MNRIFLKIFIPSVITILLFILTIFLIIIPRFQQNIMNGKREMIKELTNSAWSILSKYESDERNGLLSREEAQKTAVSRIQYLRYGDENKDYFWITDMVPNMIMHPYRSDLNGKDLTTFSDPHGKKLFVECVETVKKSQHGYVDYMWQWKDDSLHIVPKLSYVKEFKPWGWIIGTGVYIEDVKKEIKAITEKLIWISTGISIIIALLLLFISQQSLKIERKRMEADNELHESKEKYRTLVEAATEGLIMLIDGHISFVNNVIHKLTAYSSAELLSLALPEIISDSNSSHIMQVFSQGSVPEGQYEINLKKKSGGFAEVLITSSNAVLSGKKVNVLIVKDITIDRNANLSMLDYHKLLSTLNIGFFRTTVDAKGKFMFANETALQILGYNSFAELSETSIIKLLANTDDRKTLRNSLLENGYLKNKVLKIQKRNSETAYVSVTLVVYNSDNTELLICDGIIEDITLHEKEKAATTGLIAELKSGSFIIEQAVRPFLSPVYTLDSEATIAEALKAMSQRKTDYLLITKNTNDYLGIVTNSDIQNRIVSLNLHTENPVYLIMSSPVIYTGINTPVSEALNIFEEKNISHLMVRNEVAEIAGVLKQKDINKALKNSLSFLTANVGKAETDEELRSCYKSLQILIKPLILSGLSVKFITNITSSFSDSVIRRAIDMAILEIGAPPAAYSFICLGSEGRKEETLFTDQDNAIIYENVSPEKENTVNAYFLRLGEKVCNSLNHAGYAFCKGNIMAMNPQWCKPASVWEKYFENWITTPEPQNLLEATIFFDLRFIYGNEELTSSLQKSISSMVKNRSLFFYHLASHTSNIKTHQLSSSNIISEKSIEQVDLKSAISLIIMFARTYSLQNNIFCQNTLERLSALKTKQVISDSTVDEIVFSYNYLMNLRLRNQVNLSDRRIPLSNILNTSQLIDIEISVLKKVLATLPVYQKKISTDFRIST